MNTRFSTVMSLEDVINSSPELQEMIEALSLEFKSAQLQEETN